MPRGHPIILLRSNKFNMAAVSVKRSFTDESHEHRGWEPLGGSGGILPKKILKF